MEGDRDLVTALASVWDSMGALGDGFAPRDWRMITDCPGWTVQDTYAHVIGIESLTMGEPEPAAEPPTAPHVKNDIGRSNERWVHTFRACSGAEVLAKFRLVTGRRLAELHEVDFGAPAWTPVGPGTVRDSLPFRVFDCWVHEQDVRRAVDRPGAWDTPGARMSIERMASVMPMVVGKRVAPPDGTTVELSLRGPMVRSIPIGMVDGRAQILGEPRSSPTARLVMDAESFVRLACGRGDPDLILDGGAVTFEGDAALGERVARSMNFLF